MTQRTTMIPRHFNTKSAREAKIETSTDEIDASGHHWSDTCRIFCRYPYTYTARNSHHHSDTTDQRKQSGRCVDCTLSSLLSVDAVFRWATIVTSLIRESRVAFLHQQVLDQRVDRGVDTKSMQHGGVHSSDVR